MRAGVDASMGRRLLVAAASLAAAGTVLVLLLTLIPVWPLTLFEHFRVQYVVVGALVIVACAALRVRGWFDAALLATLLHLLWLLPDLVRERRPVPPGMPIRVLLYNVLSSNTRFEDVRTLIRDTNADVVALLEIEEHWLKELAPVLASYPSRVEHPRTDNFGLALYTRGALTARVEYLGAYPSIVGTLAHGTSQVNILLTHPIPPVSRELLVHLEHQLGKLATHIRAQSGPTLLLGDFNSTPWSRPFRDLLAQSGLCDSRAGFGLQASWPTWSAMMRIPIDHVLVSCDIGVRDRFIGRDAGSDHLPVIVDVVIPPR